jgi:hypothetical protein
MGARLDVAGDEGAPGRGDHLGAGAHDVVAQPAAHVPVGWGGPARHRHEPSPRAGDPDYDPD